MKEARRETAEKAQEKAKEGGTNPKVIKKCRLDELDEATKKKVICWMVLLWMIMRALHCMKALARRTKLVLKICKVRPHDSSSSDEEPRRGSSSDKDSLC
jgi:hypothetical protein